MKQLCPAVQNIIRRMRQGWDEDSPVSPKTIFSMHVLNNHRSITEFGVEKEHCTVFNVTVDSLTWQEVEAIAASNEQV